jgi:DNA-binding NarL/FixJ family response regulator
LVFIPAVGEPSATGEYVADTVPSMTGAASGVVSSLTTRQLEVLVLMAEGRSNAGIAAHLHLSEKAVVQHTSSIYGAFDLPVDSRDNRRVLAVLQFLAAAGDARRTG